MAKRYSQPQGNARIDWGNPITKGLVGAYLPQGINAVTNAAAVSITAPKTATKQGSGLLFAGGTEVAKYDSYQPGIPFTAVTLLVPNFSSSSATRQGVWVYQATSGSAQNRLRLIWLDATNGFYLDINGGFAYTCKPTFAAGDAIALAYTRAGVTPSNQFYVNGVAATTTQVVDTSNTGLPTSAAPLWLGDDVEFASGKRLNGTIALHLHFARVLTAAEIKSLSANPWQLFTPVARSIWVPVAAGGDSTITQADGTSTAGSLGGSATAATTPTQASGTSTAASIAASATAAAAVTQADGASTASTLVGVASTGSTITQADGSTVASVLAGSATSSAAATQADGASTAATLTGTGLADGAAGITPAAGTSAAETLAGSSAAVSGFEGAAGASAVSVLGGASLWEAAFSAAVGVSTCSSLVGSDATIVITSGYPDPSTVLVGISYGPTGVEYTGAFTVPSAASIAAAVRSELTSELLRITEVAKIHGLVQGTDLVVTPTSRVAGDISQTISGDGVSSSTVSRV